MSVFVFALFICNFLLWNLICWSQPSAVFYHITPNNTVAGNNCELRFAGWGWHPGKLPAIGTTASEVMQQHCSYINVWRFDFSLVDRIIFDWLCWLHLAQHNLCQPCRPVVNIIGQNILIIWELLTPLRAQFVQMLVGCVKWRADERSSVDPPVHSHRICINLSTAIIKTVSSVFLSVVPQTLLREADPYIFSSTSFPTVDTEKGNHAICCNSRFTVPFYLTS